MRFRSCCLVSMFALLGAAGCKKEEAHRDASPPPDRPAPEAKWTHNKIAHKLDLGMDMSGAATYLELTCCGREPGRGLWVTVRGGGSLEGGSTDGVPWAMERFHGPPPGFEVDLRERFADFPLDDLKPRPSFHQLKADLPINVPITVKIARYAEVKTALEATVDVEPAIYAFMASVTKGPAVFAEEPKDESIDAAIMVWGDSFSVHKTGTAKVLKDVDWVGITKSVDRQETKNCSGYARWGSSLPESITFALQDTRVDVYDRRTGAKVGDKTFSPGPCPKSASIGGKPTIAASADAIESWLNQAVKRRKL